MAEIPTAMKKIRKDLTGKVFGRLTVKEFSHKDDGLRAHWKCLCECGVEIITQGHRLTTGKTKSCGCFRVDFSREKIIKQRAEGMPSKELEDLVGNRTGRLVVKSFSHSKNQKRYWNMVCDCGGTKFLSSQEISMGRTKSCGCLSKERHQSNMLLTGAVYGELTITGFAGPDEQGKSTYRCRCNCGNETVTRGTNLKNGQTQSCGCLAKRAASVSNKTHGLSRSPEYIAWMAMKERCLNSKNKGFPGYGGRGITVCDRWKNSFENFIADMGPRPSPHHSIDRINNNGNYEPDNCRWADVFTQVNNRSVTIKELVDGVEMTSREFCTKYGISRSSIGYHRKKHGLTLQEIKDRTK